MDKTEELLNRCFKCKAYQEDECGIYFMMSLWQKKCIFFNQIKNMEKYQEFLENIGLISENEFGEVINSLPEVNISEVGFEYSDYIQDITGDSIARDIITHILNENTEYTYVDEVDFESRTYSIEDVETLEELDEIKNLFPNWTLTNYDELKNDIAENKKQEAEEAERNNLLKTISFKANIEQLRNFVETL